MKIQEIYDEYNIMPNLQLHMLRVAAVANMICEHLDTVVNKNDIISACLLHDMGNVLKFNFNTKSFPESWFAPKGKDYWKRIKKKFIQKYGANENVATETIIKELGISLSVQKIVSKMGFKKAKEFVNDMKYEAKITNYSDLRVSPFTIVTLQGRLSEAITRYKERRDFKKKVETFLPYWKIVEKQIFSHCDIKPRDISSKTVDESVDSLRSFEIETNSN